MYLFIRVALFKFLQNGTLRTLELQVMGCSVSFISAGGLLDMTGRVLTDLVIGPINGPVPDFDQVRVVEQDKHTSFWHPFTGRPVYDETTIPYDGSMPLVRTPWQSVVRTKTQNFTSRLTVNL